jgi:hypothetical protein
MRLADANPGDTVQLVGVVQEPYFGNRSTDTVSVEFSVTPPRLNREERLTMALHPELQVTVPTVVAAVVRDDNVEGDRS